MGQIEKHSKDFRKPSSRFDGSKELVDVYKAETPGESKHGKVYNIIKKVIKEVHVAGFEGKKINIENVPIRMADGKIKKLPPGKSGSSGGGGDE